MSHSQQAIEAWCRQQGLRIERTAAVNYGIQLWISDGSVQIPVIAFDKGSILVQGQESTLKQRIVAAVESTLGSDKQKRKSHATAPHQQELSPELLAIADAERIGIDEAGKGDYFGPLVIAAALIKPSDVRWLKVLGVQDSKKLFDRQVRELADQLKAALAHEIVAIMPSRYNSLYQEIGNLNKLLAWGHARALENLTARTEVRLAISDQFANQSVLQSRLMRQGRSVRLVQCHRAERDTAVAVASILARAEFLKRLESLRRKYAIKFAKGATHVLKPAREFVSKYGRDKLAEVAKLHFRTTAQI